MMRGRLGFAAALAACMSGIGSGMEVMQEMFTPRFRFDREGFTHQRRGRKHRMSGAGSKRAPSHGSDVGCGARQCRKQLAKTPHGDSYEYDKRMAWMAQPRIQAVLAKRAEDQMRAAGPLGGRNRVLWGRR